LRHAASQFQTGSSGIEHELADLRYLWGGRYRITWQDGFRATRITTGDAVEAQTSTELRKLIMIAESGATPTAGPP